MNKTEQPNEIQDNSTSGFGMSRDDLSMLNQVLQQVKGISGVSDPSYKVTDPAYSNDA